MKKINFDTKAFKKAFTYSIPVLFGYLAIGIAFGLLLVRTGYSPFLAFIMSLSIYAGAGQYMAVNFFSNNVSLIDVAVITFLINSRHMVYGLSLLHEFKLAGRWKSYMIFSLTDETYALLTGIDEPEGTNKKQLFIFIALLDHLYWVLGTVIGAVAGSMIRFDTRGLDFALTALFVVILLDQMKKYRTKLPFVIGFVSALTALLTFDRGNMLIGAVVLAMILLVILRGRIEHSDDAS